MIDKSSRRSILRGLDLLHRSQTKHSDRFESPCKQEAANHVERKYRASFELDLLSEFVRLEVKNRDLGFDHFCPEEVACWDFHLLSSLADLQRSAGSSEQPNLEDSFLKGLLYRWSNSEVWVFFFCRLRKWSSNPTKSKTCVKWGICQAFQTRGSESLNLPLLFVLHISWSIFDYFFFGLCFVVDYLFGQNLVRLVHFLRRFFEVEVGLWCLWITHIEVLRNLKTIWGWPDFLAFV